MERFFNGNLASLLYAYIKFSKNKRKDDTTAIEIVTNPNFKSKFFRFKNIPHVFFDMTFNKTALTLKEYKAFEVRDDDIWVASFPKSGTTWVQELVYTIINNGDFAKAKSSTIEKRSPLFEYPLIGINKINKMKSPRIIKTHLLMQLLPENFEKKSKVIYCVRNPKDVAVSFFHFMQKVNEADYSGTFENFVDEFIENRLPFGPWWSHVDEYFSSPYVHVVFYEDLKTKTYDTVKSLCEFLNKSFNDNQLMEIVNWCSFENMKSNPSINYNWSGIFKDNQALFRKGEIGDWRNYFSEEMSNKFDEHINKMLKTKICFNYGISNDENYEECSKL